MGECQKAIASGPRAYLTDDLRHLAVAAHLRLFQLNLGYNNETLTTARRQDRNVFYSPARAVLSRHRRNIDVITRRPRVVRTSICRRARAARSLPSRVRNVLLILSGERRASSSSTRSRRCDAHVARLLAAVTSAQAALSRTGTLLAREPFVLVADASAARAHAAPASRPLLDRATSIMLVSPGERPASKLLLAVRVCAARAQ